MTEKPIVFFDGMCVLCNRFADWLFKHDRKGKFLLASLQGQTAQKMLKTMPTDEAQWSIVVINQGQPLMRSDAVFFILSELGGGWKILSYFRILPKAVRDFFYNFIARRRRRWFGQRATCRVPQSDEKEKFLP